MADQTQRIIERHRFGARCLDILDLLPLGFGEFGMRLAIRCRALAGFAETALGVGELREQFQTRQPLRCAAGGEQPIRARQSRTVSLLREQAKHAATQISGGTCEQAFQLRCVGGRDFTFLQASEGSVTHVAASVADPS